MFQAWKYHAFPLSMLAKILQERELQGFDAGGEVMHTYSSIFRPP
jgi:hypothetical protein